MKAHVVSLLRDGAEDGSGALGNFVSLVKAGEAAVVLCKPAVTLCGVMNLNLSDFTILWRCLLHGQESNFGPEGRACTSLTVWDRAVEAELHQRGSLLSPQSG